MSEVITEMQSQKVVNILLAKGKEFLQKYNPKLVLISESAISLGDAKPDCVFLDEWKEAPFYMTQKDVEDVLAFELPAQAFESMKALHNALWYARDSKSAEYSSSDVITSKMNEGYVTIACLRAHAAKDENNESNRGGKIRFSFDLRFCTAKLTICSKFTTDWIVDTYHPIGAK